MERNIGHVRELMKEHSELFIKIENVFSDEFQEEFSTIYEKQYDRMHKFLGHIISVSQKTKHAELKSKEEEKKMKVLEENKSRARENAEKIEIFNGIFDNIRERILLLKAKCEIDLDNLNDSDLLQKSKASALLDSEFSEIIDRVTELVKATPPIYEKAEGLLNQARNAQENLKKNKNSYQEKLLSEVKNRDLTEEKLKNASILGIKIPKFKGYDSPIDYYTFKSEFEKLVVPRVYAKLLPDYLKNNYLDGQALQLVKEIDDLEKIWDRLKLSFGNVNTLLANKLKLVEGSDPLWKVKSDEKIVYSITKVKNLMMELSSLAEKHNIEASLFHSSNLAKIYFLIGRKRQADIIKKMLDVNATEKESWAMIIDYLDRELKVKEQILLFNKSHPGKSEGYERKKTDDKNVFNSYTTQLPKKCAICEKTDHVPTITNNGNSIINYFACEKFVNMSTKQRFEELKKRNLCFQCLTPGLKANHEGDCFDKYKCPDDSHKRFKNGLHVLICDRHKNKKENLDLLESYKTKYITNTNSSHRDFSKKYWNFIPCGY